MSPWPITATLLALFTLCVTRRRHPQAGERAALLLAAAAFAFIVQGVALRAFHAARPPVTDLYESVIAAALGTLLFGIILTLRQRSRAPLLATLPAAAILLSLAGNLDATLRPLAPILRSPLWLTAHVLTITLGYAAFAVALGLAHLVLASTITGKPSATAPIHSLESALKTGLFLFAVGTVLGALWAHEAWGRFWGWDPKETWALIVLLCYLALLHGQAAGWWRGFGLAAGSIAAFQTVIMAWYGVNCLLGKSLHSYGFARGGLSLACAFAFLELTFVAIAILRHRRPSRPSADSASISPQRTRRTPRKDPSFL